MPIVDRLLSSAFAKAKWRPKCHVCGRFVGIGGFFDTPEPSTHGEPPHEGGYDTCKRHTTDNPPQAGEKDND